MVRMKRGVRQEKEGEGEKGSIWDSFRDPQPREREGDKIREFLFWIVRFSKPF